MFAAHLGSGGTIVTLISATYSNQVSGSTANTTFRLANDGLVKVADFGSGGVATTRYSWVVPTSKAALYEVRATLLTGGFTSGTFGSWLALSSNRTWANNATVGTVQNGSMTVEIRDIATATIVATATIALESDASL